MNVYSIWLEHWTCETGRRQDGWWSTRRTAIGWAGAVLCAAACYSVCAYADTQGQRSSDCWSQDHPAHAAAAMEGHRGWSAQTTRISQFTQSTTSIYIPSSATSVEGDRRRTGQCKGHANPTAQLPPGAGAPQPPVVQTHPWLKVVGGQLRRRGRVNTSGSLPPGTSTPQSPPIQTHPWLRVVGGQPRRRGRAAVAPRTPPDTPIVRTWAWKPTIGGQPRRRGRANTPRVFTSLPPVHDTPLTGMVAKRRGERQAIIARTGRGKSLIVIPIPTPAVVGYYVYANTGHADSVNFNTPVATIMSYGITTWTSFGLFFPSTWTFTVRPFNQYGINQNVDTTVTFTLDANGNDVSNIPASPTGLRALPLAGGSAKIEWSYLAISTAAKKPTGFNVYSSTGSTPNYSSPVATVPFSSGLFNAFSTTLTGLTNGTTYAVGVRAYNSTGQESNNVFVLVTADSVGPSPVIDLTITATNQAS